MIKTLTSTLCYYTLLFPQWVRHHESDVIVIPPTPAAYSSYLHY